MENILEKIERKHFGMLMKRARTEAGLSQRELGIALGVSPVLAQRRVHEMERRASFRLVPVATVAVIAQACGKSLYWFLETETDNTD